MIGRTIAHFEILEKLGEGGMGVVYKARDTHLERLVAIKVLPPERVTDPERKRRFIQEARAASALNHPNIITVHDIACDAGVDFMVMEFVTGKTLDELVGRKGLKLNDTLKYGAQIAAALATAHAAGIIHRDLKPSNVMVADSGLVKVLDFGLAKLAEAPPSEADATATLDPRTEEGTIMGTAAYMSPEQAQGKKLDARSDIFSFGSVLYEMVTGRRAFPGETKISTLSAILERDPTPISQIVPGMPPTLEEIITKALEKSLDLRYQTASDLCADLRRLEREQGSSKAGPITRARKVIDSLAVLPFANTSGDSDTEYLSDGITESIINTLSQLPKLRLVPRSTVFRYKGREADFPELARELNVRAILMGRVAQRGENLVIQSELVDLVNESQLWGGQFNRRISDILEVQDEIAKEISEKLRLRITGEERKRLTRRYTQNTTAYQDYLKGRFYWNKRTRDGFKKAIEHFGKAIEEDPVYALAYAGLADCYALFGFYTYLHPREAFPKAKAAAVRALEIDEKLAEAHTSMILPKVSCDWDWEGAEKEALRALDLNPAYATAHQWYSCFFLSYLGRLEEALAEMKRALELDPLSLSINSTMGSAFYYARRYEEAAEFCRKTLEMEPNFIWARLILGWAHEQQGMFQDALAEFEKAKIHQGTPLPLAGVGHTYALAGKKAEAMNVLGELVGLSRQTYVPSYFIAAIHLALGDTEQAFSWLEKAFEERTHWLVYLKVDPIFDPLRSDARFQVMLRRIGLAI